MAAWRTTTRTCSKPSPTPTSRRWTSSYELCTTPRRPCPSSPVANLIIIVTIITCCVALLQYTRLDHRAWCRRCYSPPHTKVPHMNLMCGERKNADDDGCLGTRSMAGLQGFGAHVSLSVGDPHAVGRAESALRRREDLPRLGRRLPTAPLLKKHQYTPIRDENQQARG